MLRRNSALIMKCSIIRKITMNHSNLQDFPSGPKDRIAVPTEMLTYGTRSFLGFVSSGHMGTVLMKNLLASGTNIICYNRKSKKRKEIENKGGICLTTPAEVAAKTDIIFTYLPDYKKLVACMEGDTGIIKTARKGTIIVDLSTIGPVNAMRIEMALEGSELKFLSAPVCGGSRTDIKHSMIFLVGGNKEIFEKVKPYLNYMASRQDEKVVFHIGENIGDGQAARICNILLEGCCMVGTSEVMNLGIKLGLDPTVLAQALNSSTARCWICQEYNPVPDVVSNAPASSNYEGGETIFEYLKSLSVAQDTATKIFSPIPVSALACQMFSLAMARGHAEKDFSAVYKIYKQTIVQAV